MPDGISCANIKFFREQKYICIANATVKLVRSEYAKVDLMLMASVAHYIQYWMIVALSAIIRFLPEKLGRALVDSLVLPVFYYSRRYKMVSQRNLALAYPDKCLEWREEIRKKSAQSLSRLVYEVFVLDLLDHRWIENHVLPSQGKDLLDVWEKNRHRAVIFVGGHLGSFEVMANVFAMIGVPLSFVVRDFKNPLLERWIANKRSCRGNQIIPRSGAYRTILRKLRTREAVGFLFDQNVTRNYAVFCNWFGRPAATTKALGLSAVHEKAIIIVLGFYYRGEGNYETRSQVIDPTDIYENGSLSTEEKILQVTQRAVDCFEEFIRESPGEWFWFHRRWKTTPEGVPEDFYK